MPLTLTEYKMFSFLKRVFKNRDWSLRAYAHQRLRHKPDSLHLCSPAQLRLHTGWSPGLKLKYIRTSVSLSEISKYSLTDKLIRGSSILDSQVPQVIVLCREGLEAQVWRFLTPGRPEAGEVEVFIV